MKPYRLHLLEGDGTLDRVLPFEAQSDDMARAWADLQRYGRGAELWDLSRLVERYRRDRAADGAVAG